MEITNDKYSEAVKLLNDKNSSEKIKLALDENEEDLNKLIEYAENNTNLQNQIKEMMNKNKESKISKKEALRMAKNLKKQNIDDKPKIALVQINKGRKTKLLVKSEDFIVELNQKWNKFIIDKDLDYLILVYYDPEEKRKNTKASKIAQKRVCGDVYFIHVDKVEQIAINVKKEDLIKYE